MSSFLIDKIDGKWHVELNGVDITNMIADGGVRIASREWPLPPAVEVTLIPQQFRANFPEADVAISEAEVSA